MTALRAVLIVGASATSAALVGQLREDGFSGPVVVLDADSGPERSAPGSSLVVSAESSNTSWEGCERVTARATALDPSTAEVTAILPDGSGTSFSADHVVIATGSRPLSLRHRPVGVEELRTASDARRPHGDDFGRRYLVVGAGITGTEVASALIRAGGAVTVVERTDRPLDWLLGGHLAAEAADWMRAAGVALRMNSAVEEVVRDADGFRLRTSTGDIECDEVFSAIGAAPNIGWLQGSGLDIDGALQCDAEGTALRRGAIAPRVHAIGNCARWLAGDSVLYRGNRWPTARTQAQTVGRKLLGLPPSEVLVPDLAFCWSDQFGRLIQVLGTPPHDGVLVPLLAHNELPKAFYRIDQVGGAVAWIAINALTELIERLGPLIHASF